MKFGVSWGPNEIHPETRETDEQAARRAGMSLEDWLNTMIVRQAELANVQSPAPAGDHLRNDDITAVNHRLDDLTQRFDQLTRTGPAAYAPKRSFKGPAAYAPKRSRGEANPPLASELAPPPRHPETPSVRLPPSLEHAVAEIVARQRVLNGEAAPSRLEALVEPSHDKIEENSRSNADAFSHLEHRIAVLADKCRRLIISDRAISHQYRPMSALLR